MMKTYEQAVIEAVTKWDMENESGEGRTAPYLHMLGYIYDKQPREVYDDFFAVYDEYFNIQ